MEGGVEVGDLSPPGIIRQGGVTLRKRRADAGHSCVVDEDGKTGRRRGINDQPKPGGSVKSAGAADASDASSVIPQRSWTVGRCRQHPGGAIWHNRRAQAKPIPSAAPARDERGAPELNPDG